MFVLGCASTPATHAESPASTSRMKRRKHPSEVVKAQRQRGKRLVNAVKFAFQHAGLDTGKFLYTCPCLLRACRISQHRSFSASWSTDLGFSFLPAPVLDESVARDDISVLQEKSVESGGSSDEDEDETSSRSSSSLSSHFSTSKEEREEEECEMEVGTPAERSIVRFGNPQLRRNLIFSPSSTSGSRSGFHGCDGKHWRWGILSCIDISPRDVYG